MTFNVDEWMKARIAKRMKSAKEMNKLGKFFQKLGYKYLRVSYQGAGDSGEAFTTEGWKNESWSKLATLDYEDRKHGTWNQTADKYDKPKDEWEGTTRNQKEIEKFYSLWKKENPNSKLSDEISYVLVNLIDYDWYNNEGGQGCVIWDLEAGQIFVDGEQNVYACKVTTETYFVNGDKPTYTYDDSIREN